MRKSLNLTLYAQKKLNVKMKMFEIWPSQRSADFAASQSDDLTAVDFFYII